MIDEKKLIVEINQMVYKSEMHSPRYYALEEVLNIVEQQLKVGEWIPCSERLPEEYGDYLIAWFHTNKYAKAMQKGKHYYEICEYSPEEGWLSDFKQCPEGYEVIAWQPLPEPWE